MKTVHVTAVLKLVLKVDEDEKLADILSNLTVVEVGPGPGSLEDSRIESPEVTDSH